MFSKQILIFILLGLFALQEASCLKIENDERSLIDLINKAKEAIRKLTDAVKNAVENALHKLIEIKDNILEFAKDVINNATDAIMEEIRKVKEQIEAIKEQAEAVGVDIKECLEENLPALEALPKKIISKLISCVTNEVIKAKQIIEDAIADILALADVVVNLPVNLKNCIVSGRPIKCLSNLIADIVSSIVSIPATIAAKVNEIIRLVTGIEGNLKSCAVKRVIEASVEAAAIAIDVAKCVAEKIKE